MSNGNKVFHKIPNCQISAMRLPFFVSVLSFLLPLSSYSLPAVDDVDGEGMYQTPPPSSPHTLNDLYTALQNRGQGLPYEHIPLSSLSVDDLVQLCLDMGFELEVDGTADRVLFEQAARECFKRGGVPYDEEEYTASQGDSSLGHEGSADQHFPTSEQGDEVIPVNNMVDNTVEGGKNEQPQEERNEANQPSSGLTAEAGLTAEEVFDRSRGGYYCRSEVDDMENENPVVETVVTTEEVIHSQFEEDGKPLEIVGEDEADEVVDLDDDEVILSSAHEIPTSKMTQPDSSSHTSSSSHSGAVNALTDALNPSGLTPYQFLTGLVQHIRDDLKMLYRTFYPKFLRPPTEKFANMAKEKVKKVASIAQEKAKERIQDIFQK